MTLEHIGLLLSIGVAGGIGAVLRHWLSNRPDAWMPWGTLAANTIATVIAASALVILELNAGLPLLVSGDDWPPTLIGYTLVVGLAGGMSTFSTVAGQVAELIRCKHWLRAVCYALASFAIPSTAALLLVSLL